MAIWTDSTQQAWQPIRPELTNGVSGKLLLDGATKMVLTRLEPGGSFRPHRDSYGHLFHILAGSGRFRVEEQEQQLSAGMTLQVEAGELHGYENCAAEQLLLISLNLPVPDDKGA